MPKVAKAAPDPVIEVQAQEDDGLVRLRATFPYAEQFSGVEYFYDGELPVTNGRIAVPADRHDWISRLLASGYQLIEDGLNDD